MRDEDVVTGELSAPQLRLCGRRRASQGIHLRPDQIELVQLWREVLYADVIIEKDVAPQIVTQRSSPARSAEQQD